jgi:hypothetical protein
VKLDLSRTHVLLICCQHTQAILEVIECVGVSAGTTLSIRVEPFTTKKTTNLRESRKGSCQHDVEYVQEDVGVSSDDSERSQ